MYLSLLLTFGIPSWFCSVLYSVLTRQVDPGGLATTVLLKLTSVPFDTISVTGAMWAVTRWMDWTIRRKEAKEGNIDVDSGKPI